MVESGKYVQVFVTVPGKNEAGKLAGLLLESKLAACVQTIGPITSRYRWKGKLEESEEWLCLIKTRKSLYGKLEKAIKEAHPYDVSEIIATPITAGLDDYFKWMDGELS